MTTGPRRRGRQAVRLEERYWEHIPDVFGSVEDISDALVCREQHQFLFTDAAGNIPVGNHRGLGLYSHDARHLSVYDFLLDGARPLVLLSSADAGFMQQQVLGNTRVAQGEKVIGRATLELVRERVLDQHLSEALRITNFNPFPVTIEPAYYFDADFADIFEVRGHKRTSQPQHSRPEVGERSICYRCLGADGSWRRTLIVFDQAPESIGPRSARFRLSLAPRESVTLGLRILLDERGEAASGDSRQRLSRDYERWRASFSPVLSDNQTYNLVIDRALTDLRMLWTDDRHGDGYFAAGTPWFATLFGRDSLITSLQTLPFRPDFARHTLSLLARNQGQSEDAFREETPGKILHEMREDELSVAGELPYQRYYGSVDATPLFLLLAAEYFHWTGDLEFIAGLMPALNPALNWPSHYGDLDGGGFIEYRTDSPSGLRNQGWKDSDDGVMHEDGSPCDGPVALCEVQGYLYAAYLRLAPVLQALGEEERARQLRAAAAELRSRFNQAFWLPRLNRLAMALDGAKRPSTVVSSNAGQALWSGILSRERAALVRDAVLQPDMFSGWGVRTLSSNSHGYYPLGYHVGTVWPHDNGVIAMGFKRYGFDREVNLLATALFEAACTFPSYRLPELFGGQPRRELQLPVPYPVACRPQAWTSGVQFHLLQAMLGLHADAGQRFLWLVRPQLPVWLKELELRGLRVGNGEADLTFQRQGSRTIVSYRVKGDLNVAVASSWRRFIF